MGKEVLFGTDSKSKILEGIKIVKEAVSCTLGPKGNLVLIDKEDGKIKYTKDGVTVSRSISFSDKYKNIGAMILKEAATNTNRHVGDGTTTTTVITANLIESLDKSISLGADPVHVKKGVELCKEDILEELENYKIPIKSKSDIYNIAYISANNDCSVASVISEAFENIGDDGIVLCSTSFGEKTTLKFSTGLDVPNGYISSDFTNHDDKVILDDSKILLYNGVVFSDEKVNLTINNCVKENKSLLIIANDFDSIFVTKFKEYVLKKRLKSACLVRVPAIVNMVDFYQNLSAYLSCSIIEENFDKIDLEKDLGYVETITISPNTTIITNSLKDNEESLNKRINILKKSMIVEDGEPPLDEETKSYILEQIAKISGGIATINIGSNIQSELLELKDRYDDALNAVKSSIKGGIIPGGGTTLFKIANKLRNKLKSKRNLSESELLGYKTLLSVCEEPIKKIISSANKSELPFILHKIVSNKKNNVGYDAKKDSLVKDIVKEGIVDPLLVVKYAIISAVSSSTNFLMTYCSIVSDLKNVSYKPTDEIIFNENFGALR